MSGNATLTDRRDVSAGATAASPRPARARTAAQWRRWRRVASPVVLAAAWEALGRSGAASPDKLPPPSDVLAAGGAWPVTARWPTASATPWRGPWPGS